MYGAIKSESCSRRDWAGNTLQNSILKMFKYGTFIENNRLDWFWVSLLSLLTWLLQRSSNSGQATSINNYTTASVMRTAAQLVCATTSHYALKSVHWLPVRQRIEFKLCRFVHLVVTYANVLIKATASMPIQAFNRSYIGEECRVAIVFNNRATNVYIVM